jgi:hypothetical protein
MGSASAFQIGRMKEARIPLARCVVSAHSVAVEGVGLVNVS